MHAVDISWGQLILGSILFGTSFYALHYYKTGITRAAFISYGRMTLQLILLGFYLKYIFQLDSPWINLLWVGVMIIAASFR